MSLYVDSSALVKRYLDEADADRARALLDSDDFLATARLTMVEVRSTLARALESTHLATARRELSDDLRAMTLVELDAMTCERAATIAEELRVRSLDALHLAAAQRLGETTTVLTFDLRMAQAARSLGMSVVGA